MPAFAVPGLALQPGLGCSSGGRSESRFFFLTELGMGAGGRNSVSSVRGSGIDEGADALQRKPTVVSEPLATFALILGREAPIGPFDIWKISLFTLKREGLGEKGGRAFLKLGMPTN